MNKNKKEIKRINKFLNSYCNIKIEFVYYGPLFFRKGRRLTYNKLHYGEFFRQFNSDLFSFSKAFIKNDIRRKEAVRLLIEKLKSHPRKFTLKGEEWASGSSTKLNLQLQFNSLMITQNEINEIINFESKLESFFEHQLRLLYIKEFRNINKYSEIDEGRPISEESEKSKRSEDYIQLREVKIKLTPEEEKIKLFYEEIEKRRKEIALENEVKKIKYISTTFCWNKSRSFEEDLLKLYTLLKESEFIARDTSFDKFCIAFSCNYLDKPLNIVWSKTVKGKLSKSLILHFIDQLERYNLIKVIESNYELFKILNTVFVGPSNEPLRNLDITKSTWLNRKSFRTPQEYELDMLLRSVFEN